MQGSSLATRLDFIVAELFPDEASLAIDEMRRNTTADGRVRADRLVGRVPDSSVPAISAESVGSLPIGTSTSDNVQEALDDTSQAVVDGSLAVGNTQSVQMTTVLVSTVRTIFAAVNYAGSGTAETAARSNHTHTGIYSPVTHTHTGTYAPAPLSGTAALDFPSIAAGQTADLTIPVTGAAVNDRVTLGPPVLAAGLVPSGFVSAAGTVTVRLMNATATAIDPPLQTWGVWVG